MARNRVHAAERLEIIPTVAHNAGDLVFHNGFFGIAEDNLVVGKRGYIILRDAWLLPRVPSTVAQGVILAALATQTATTLPMIALPQGTVNVPTTGYVPVGRVIATGNASVAKVQLFNPNPWAAVLP